MRGRLHLAYEGLRWSPFFLLVTSDQNLQSAVFSFVSVGSVCCIWGGFFSSLCLTFLLWEFDGGVRWKQCWRRA